MLKIVLDFNIQENRITFGPIQEKELEPLEFGEVQQVGRGGSINLSGAAPGQMIIVKAVDANGKPTEWEAIDRTHGEGFPEELMPETYLADEAGSWDPLEAWYVLNHPIILIEGETYFVTINGTKYTGVAVKGDEIDSDGENYGNIRLNLEPSGGGLIYNPNGIFGTDDLFSVYYPANPPFEDEVVGTYLWEPITLSVYNATSGAKKLDVKYLDMTAIKAALPSAEMVATFDDGSKKTFKLYGEAVTE